jgi:hypothetical protein
VYWPRKLKGDVIAPHVVVLLAALELTNDPEGKWIEYLYASLEKHCYVNGAVGQANGVLVL